MLRWRHTRTWPVDVSRHTEGNVTPRDRSKGGGHFCVELRGSPRNSTKHLRFSSTWLCDVEHYVRLIDKTTIAIIHLEINWNAFILRLLFICQFSGTVMSCMSGTTLCALFVYRELDGATVPTDIIVDPFAINRSCVGANT